MFENLFANNFVGFSMSAANKGTIPFALNELDKSAERKAITSCLAMQSTCAQAAAACIRESNSVDECVSFARIHPSPYVLAVAKARINELSSTGRKLTVIGGRETNE